MTRRLAEVVVRPAGEAAHPVRVAGASGEHDHRQGGVEARGQPVGRPDAVEQRQSACALESQVEHHERRLAYLDRPQTLFHAARPGHTEAVGGEVVEQEASGQFIVLDHEKRAQFGHLRVRLPAWPFAPLQTPLHNSRRRRNQP